MVEDALAFPGDAQEGMRAICGREIQKSLKESAKFLIESKLIEYGLGEADGFKVFKTIIETPGDGIITFEGLQDHTAESIKSFEGFHRFWCEEAHTVSAPSIELIKPTIRWENTRLGLKSEMWWSWNPRRKSDAIDKLLRGAALPTGAVVVKSNWSDNPWFPKVLNEERLNCLRLTPDQYDHVWDGGYATVLAGAYYAKDLALAKQQGRISIVAPDPNLRLRIVCDLGGTGAKADAFSIWICQFVGRQILMIDYYEAQGQPLSAHLLWLGEKGYKPNRCDVWLPHDGTTNDRVFDASFESGFRAAGYDVVTVKNQGTGAARLRIESARRVFPSIWFNEKTTEAGRDALGWYHEKQDDERQIGLGPDHDWSSHCADAFGLMCVIYEAPIADNDDDGYDDSQRTRSAITGY